MYHNPFFYTVFNHYKYKKMQNLNQIEEILNSIKEDATKFFEKGNKAAGTRVRKAMQEVKALAQAVRTEVSEKNKEA